MWNATYQQKPEIARPDLSTPFWTSLGAEMEQGVSAKDLPAWKRGFLAGANYVLRMFAGGLHDLLRAR